MAGLTVAKVAGGAWPLRDSIQFGGQQVPIGAAMSAGTMPYVDLNDGVTFRAQDLHLPDAHTLQMARLSFRGRAILMASDNEPVIIGIPFLLEENVQTLSDVRSSMLAAGTQWLTFDSGIHGVLCNCRSFGKTSSFLSHVDVLSWQGELEFLCQEPFYRDIASTTIAPANVPASSGGGTTTPINVTYSGGFWTEPLYTFAMPTVGGTPNVTFTLTNTTASLALTFSLPTNGNSYVVDCALLQIYLSGNKAVQIQHSGSFPMIYPARALGATLLNALTVSAVCTSSCTPTMAISYQNRYSL